MILRLSRGGSSALRGHAHHKGNAPTENPFTNMLQELPIMLHPHDSMGCTHARSHPVARQSSPQPCLTRTVVLPLEDYSPARG